MLQQRTKPSIACTYSHNDVLMCLSVCMNGTPLDDLSHASFVIFECVRVWYKLKSCFDVALHVHLMIKTIQWHFIVCPKQLNINRNFRCIWISNIWNGVAFIVHVSSSKKRKLHFAKFIWANLINITHQYIHAIIVSIKKEREAITNGTSMH